MSNELPRRPFRDLTPPPQGLESVRTAARRRRTTRAIATGATSAVAIVAFAVFALSDSKSNGGFDRIGPAHEATSTPIVDLPTQSPTPPAGGVGTDPASTSSPVPVAESPRPTPAATGIVDNGTPGPSYTTPAMSRTYHAAIQTSQATVCGTSISGDSVGHPTTGDGWCTDVSTTTVGSGVDISYEVCRDATAAGSLTFKTNLEADLTVSHFGTVVWRWSKDHPAYDDVHAVDFAKSTCWNWVVHWTAVDQHGRKLDPGHYTLLGTSHAPELRNQGPSETPFTL